MKLYDDLVWRGLIKDISSPKLEEKLNKGGMTFYLGADPSADSLQLGQLSVFMLSKRLKDAGHRSILLVGGATGRIGDPRPTAERTLIPDEVFNKNKEGIRKQVTSLFGCDEVVDNWDWSKEINFVDYLRDYGKFFPVGYMLQRETVRRRLEIGITYAEFSYMIMQALDFLWLFENKACTLQIGGSDQWGNITAGVDLIRKKTGKEAYALCMPLVTDKDGKKMGKSEGNALWIDRNLTSEYELYQYLVNTDDKDVINYLKIFTFLSKDEIDEYEIKVKDNPEKREAGKRLGFEVVKFLHGEDAAKKVQETAEKVFSGETTSEMLTKEITGETDILSILVNAGLAPSKSEARRLVEQGGISIDNEKITNPSTKISKSECVLQKGKKTIIKVVIK